MPNALPPGANGGDLPPTLFPYLVVGRAVVALFGTLSCLLVYASLRRFGAGLAAAALGATTLAITPVAVSNAHYLTPDVPSSFGTALALLGAAGLLDRRTRSDAILAGLGAGLAASAKYNAGLVVLVPLVALAIRSDHRQHWRSQLVWLAAAGLVGFVLTSPFVVLDPAATIAAMQLQLQAYQGGHLGAQGSNNVAWYLGMLIAQSWGPGLSALAGYGLIVGAINPSSRRMSGLLAGFIGAYVIAMGLAATRFERNLLPVLPFLACASGMGLCVSVGWLRQVALPGPLRHRPTLARVTGAFLIVAGLLPALVATVRADAWLAVEDTRSIAFHLAESRLPPGARVAIEWYTPQLEWAAFPTTSFNTLGQHPVSWYRAEGYEYLVLSSYSYGRHVAEPAAATPAALAYREMFALPLVFEVPEGLAQPGPTVRAYRLAQ